MELSRGLIHLYIGEGKGKTTSAIGAAIRAKGWNLRVLFCQFLKSVDTGEQIFFSNAGIPFFRSPLRHKSFIWHQSDNELEETAEDIIAGWLSIKDKLKDFQYDLIVFDEILDVVNCNFLHENELIQIIKGKNEKTEMILTGREATDPVKELADYITVMQPEKHPFNKGIAARKGIEF